jgi:hypothetical protein
MVDQVEQDQKTCIRCSENYPAHTYPKDGKGRYSRVCRVCRNARRRERGESVRRRVLESPEDRRVRLLYEQYRLTPDQYAALMEAQGNRCAICQTPPAAGKRLAIDHCHTTGVVRGLLCIACNLALGFYEKYRLSAQEYLAAYGTGHPLLKQ